MIDKLLKTIKYLTYFITVSTLYTIIISIGVYLLDHKIIVFRWGWVKYPYFFGIGIIGGIILGEIRKRYEKDL